jgi:hypothetical protein
MFHHIVLMKYTPQADASFFGKVEGYCDRIRRSSPSVRRYVHLRNESARRDALDWAIVSSFESTQAHDAYQVSPLHQEMKAFMTPYIERIVVCDADEEKP